MAYVIWSWKHSPYTFCYENVVYKNIETQIHQELSVFFVYLRCLFY